MTNTYFSRSDAETLSFFKLPKALFTEEKYIPMSAEAKVLYAFLLDRLSLSLANEWFDKNGNAFIIYTLKEIQEAFHTSRPSAIKRLDELEAADLLKRSQSGIGRASKIYLKKLVIEPKEEYTDPSDDTEESGPEDEKTVRVKNFDTDENDAPEAENAVLNNFTRRVKKFDTIKTDINKTDYSKESIYLSEDAEPMDGSILQESESSEDPPSASVTVQEQPADYNIYYTRQFNIDKLMNKPEHASDKPLLQEIVRLCADMTSACDRSASVTIGKHSYSSQEARERFMRLSGEDIEYFLDCFGNTCSQIRNPKAYILTSLFNAPLTINSYKACKTRRKAGNVVLPAYYYEGSETQHEDTEDTKPIDRAALIAEMTAAARS
ncbi:MAG: replication initiator protein A [Galactobacillus timonensis]|nr:replication initiator protein A [Galactobacillus timonensis]